MVSEHWTSGFKFKNELLDRRSGREVYSGGTTYLTPKAIDALIALAIPVARAFISEIDFGGGRGESLRRVIEALISKLPGKMPFIELVALDRQIPPLVVLRQAIKELEGVNRVDLLGADARSVPLPDKARDLVFVSGLLTQNIADGAIQQIISEAVRVSETVVICDFDILDPSKSYQRKIIPIKRLEEFQNRYQVTAEALGVPFGTIISTSQPGSNLVLEEKLRALEQKRDIVGMRQLYQDNQSELRLSRHFEPVVLEEWLVARGASVAYSEVGVCYLSPSGNPLSGIILIGYDQKKSMGSDLQSITANEPDQQDRFMALY